MASYVAPNEGEDLCFCCRKILYCRLYLKDWENKNLGLKIYDTFLQYKNYVLQCEHHHDHHHHLRWRGGVKMWKTLDHGEESLNETGADD